MKNIKGLIWTFALTVSLSLCVAGLSFAAEEEVPVGVQAEAAETVLAQAETEVADAQTEAAAEAEKNGSETVEAQAEEDRLKTLGEKSEGTIEIEVTNDTGIDIAYISIYRYDPDPLANNSIVKMQEALIEQGFLNDVADGSAGPKTQAAIASFREANGMSADGGADEEMLEKLLGPGYDGNLLAKDDLFKAGEKRILYIAVEKEDEKEVVEVSGTDIEVDYVLTFNGIEKEPVYTLYVFPAKAMERASICIEDGMGYVIYTAAGSDTAVSTLDDEKAVIEAYKASTVQDTGYYDYGYDYSYNAGYDYSYDYGNNAGYDYGYTEPAYTEPAYVEPVYEAPYIVFQENYPSCDDGSHGVTYIEYSDGTTATFEY